MLHRCVTRKESLTTKVRVVFDASAVTDNGVSLNYMQMVRSTLQDDLFSILDTINIKIQNKYICNSCRCRKNV